MSGNKKSMTDTEKRLFRIISEDPMISQIELAHRANLSRSAVSVHISNLIKKGYIAGRGYVIGAYESIVVVGSAMLDVYGKSKNPLLDYESNPGQVSIHPGGVSRNISENLARLGLKVHLITSICDDPFGQLIQANCTELGIDISHSYYPVNETSTLYMALLDEAGEMRLALSDTTALDKMPLEHLIRKEAILNQADVIIMDASLPGHLMKHIAQTHRDKHILVDPVSIGKAKKLKDILSLFDTLKCNRNEAEYLSGVTIQDDASLQTAAQFFIDQGLEQIFITLGGEGVFYQNRFESGTLKPQKVDIINATGAGDAFSAGVAYSILSNTDIHETARFASVMSSFALESMTAVNESLTLQAIHERLETKEAL